MERATSGLKLRRKASMVPSFGSNPPFVIFINKSSARRSSLRAAILKIMLYDCNINSASSCDSSNTSNKPIALRVDRERVEFGHEKPTIRGTEYR